MPSLVVLAHRVENLFCHGIRLCRACSDGCGHRRPSRYASRDPLISVFGIVKYGDGVTQIRYRRRHAVQIERCVHSARVLDHGPDVNTADGANEKLRGPLREPIALQRLRLAKIKIHRAFRVRCASGRVGAAERALTGAHRPLGRRAPSRESPAQRSTVATTFVTRACG